MPAFEYPRPDATVPLHFVGPVTPSSDLPTPQWWGELDGPAPVVLVTQGTVANQDLGELVRPTVDALADSDALVVVTTGGRPVPEVGPLPSNVRAAEYLPYDQLFARLDLLVTNGGYGGVHYALAHAVPIVVAGGGEDKPEVAARVAWSGVGVNLRTGRPKSEAIRRAVRRVLDDPSYRVAAQRVAGQIAAAPGIGGLEKLILDLAAAGEATRQARTGPESAGRVSRSSPDPAPPAWGRAGRRCSRPCPRSRTGSGRSAWR